MKTILLSIITAVLVSGLAIALAYACGANGETFQIIAGVTVLVSCSAAFVASSLGLLLTKKKKAPR